jgi:crotonobetainyl-CoA:carnitine CoA-transferase CaiB-like acyl-CoA transferase
MTVTPPLAGLRVLELARILAGPWIGQVLADLGADVDQGRERPRATTRGANGVRPSSRAHGGEHLSAAYFHSCQPRQAVGGRRFFGPSRRRRRWCERLAAHADVLIENFKLGGLAKYGLDYQSLAAGRSIRASIYCSITGFGHTGPYAPRAGYDFMIQGMGGVMSI